MAGSNEILSFILAQDNNTKLYFYERLAFNLTLGIRSVWSNSSVSDSEKIEAIKTINELSHRIFNWLWQIRKRPEASDDKNHFSDIQSYAQQNSIAAGEITEALKSSYQSY